MIYKLYHCCDYSIEDQCIYIESDLCITKIADLIIGLTFYIEKETKYGLEQPLEEDQLAHFLCQFFGCSIYPKDKLQQAEFYDEARKDILPIYWIDSYTEREMRCGSLWYKFYDLILPFKDTEFIKCLVAYFNDPYEFKVSAYTPLTAKEILKKYGEQI